MASKIVPAKVARLGGDEFGVLITNIENEPSREIAERLLKLVREQRFDWEDRHYSLSASIGVVFIDEGTPDADAAMRSADEACYAAKDAGRNRVQEYELGDARMMRRRGVMEWVTQLDKAIDDGRLILNCQRIAPVPLAANGATSHYEILLTMRDELGDLMPPSEFILAAETYNRVTMVDRWVVENVLKWMADHRSSLDNFGGFAINVSGHSVNDESFADFVFEQFSRMQAPTSKVCFEITETAAIANLDNARDFMNRMKIIGCRFSLDDFGTGLSSYSYLRNSAGRLREDRRCVRERPEQQPQRLRGGAFDQRDRPLSRQEDDRGVRRERCHSGAAARDRSRLCAGIRHRKAGLAFEPAARTEAVSFAPALRNSSSAFCECNRFPASAHTTDRESSNTSSLTSSPRCAGRQCMKHRVAPGEIEQLPVDLIARESLATFARLGFMSHRRPDVGHHQIGTANGVLWRIDERDPIRAREQFGDGSNPFGQAICRSKPNWCDASIYELHML